MRKGFTLVELSIVLVIIGLLIGGILVAQSMISTAKITAQVQQISQFDAGVESFKTRYKYLPGDAPAFGGNGDGLIDHGVGGNPYYVYIFMCELANFWNGIDPQEYAAPGCATTGVQIVTSGVNKDVPLSKLGANGSFFIASALSVVGSGSAADQSNPRNFYAILSASQGQAPQGIYYYFTPTYSSYVTLPTPPMASATKPSEVLALDSKMDDGKGNSGNVLSGSIEACCGNAQVGAISSVPRSTCSNSSTGVYAVQNNSYECTPLIRIGAQAGDPQ